MLGKIEGNMRRGQQWMRWLDSNVNAMDMNLSELQEMVRDREAWYAISMWLQRVRQDLSAEQQQTIPLNTVLVLLDYCNKIFNTIHWTANKQQIFLTVLKAEKSRDQVAGKPCIWWGLGVSFCVLPWEMQRERERKLVYSSSYKSTNLIMRVPPSWSVEGDFICQLDWVNGCLDNW